jgi:hypothetical protein
VMTDLSLGFGPRYGWAMGLSFAETRLCAAAMAAMLVGGCAGEPQYAGPWLDKDGRRFEGGFVNSLQCDATAGIDGSFRLGVRGFFEEFRGASDGNVLFASVFDVRPEAFDGTPREASGIVELAITGTVVFVPGPRNDPAIVRAFAQPSEGLGRAITPPARYDLGAWLTLEDVGATCPRGSVQVALSGAAVPWGRIEMYLPFESTGAL